MMLAVGLLSAIMVATLSVMICASRAMDGTSVQTYTDADAVTVMQKIVNDVRESKTFSIANNGTRLVLNLPTVTAADQCYDRKNSTTGNQIEYYLSDSSGTPGNTGTQLWIRKNNVPLRALRKDVSSVTFIDPNAANANGKTSVEITLTTSNNTARGAKQTELTERVVYLRNY